MTSQSSTQTANLVIVDDGQYRWAADRQQLLTALAANGWTQVGDTITTGRIQRLGAVYQEPECDDPTGPDAPYTVLCGDVDSLSGEGSAKELTGEVEAQAAGRFALREDLGHGVWTLSL